ncbi:FMN-binding negative transcriptional regulator [Actibacterium ureilyticum]|uniref:FMN-binding negative transcriptional regulator n=1 Tax=Actibacterium ureilyticum TaxID=1590614 RepID=UPI000BAABE3C|nr:FMN-binding negative transcriptional regulator [Actibacterium ureilyticum]
MHPNPAFRGTPRDANLEFARKRGFGTLCANAADGPILAHVPFLLSEDGAALELHLVRSNPLLKLLPGPVVMAVSGPDGYVSPDWYGVEDQVPTWNYVAVHLRGTLETRPAGELRDLLDRQSVLFEDRLAPKPPWTTAKMTPEILDRMMRTIIPCRMLVTAVDGTWKLNQNKDDAVRLAAADQIDESDLSIGATALADLMRRV